MKKMTYQIIWCFCWCSTVLAQRTISGVVVLSEQQDYSGIQIYIKGTSYYTQTNQFGQFWLEVPSDYSGELLIEKRGFYSESIQVEVGRESLNLGKIVLRPLSKNPKELNRIVLTDDDLLEDGERNDFTAGLFQYSKDEYLKAAAYNFSQTWFKLRGVDASYNSYLINGIKMNKMSNGRPQWSNWGGLNDAFKNQNNSVGLSWSDEDFGGVLGVTAMSAKAVDFTKFNKVSFASTNRSYKGRIMASHASGVMESGWAYVVSGSGRYAAEGFYEGTPYKSWAAFISVGKRLNPSNSLNFTGFISSNLRGKSSPATDEVYQLRDYRYNSYWGRQNNKQRNSRIRNVFEPVLMLVYDYHGENSEFSATVSYQFGSIQNSRLGYYKAENPDPTYYKKLPSYFLSDVENPDYSGAYLALKELQSNGQINWSELYNANITNGASVYYLYNDVVADAILGLSLSYDISMSKGRRWLSGLRLRSLNSKNYAKMEDLLGGSHFTDLNQYGEGNGIQNDLNNPNRHIREGDEFQYNYNITSQEVTVFTQYERLRRRVEYFAGIEGAFIKSQRFGNYKNGSYEDNSFGAGASVSLSALSAKAGLTYKYTGRHLITLNAGFISKIPPLQNLYANQRVSNKLIPKIETESILAGDVTYRYRSSIVQGRLTAYYLKFNKGIESSFFFAQGILGDAADFVNEIITNVEKQNLGVELSLSYQITDALKLIGAGTFADYIYTNNPELFLESESFPLENVDFGTSYLKNIKQGNTPQRAFSLGFEYRDNDFWWFQANANYLSNNYLDVAPLLRTSNFYLDENGVPFTNEETGQQITKEEALGLLKQEEFDSVFLLNLVGGKTWKVNDSYVGFFMVVNNVLGSVFRSGGFEQGRKANYPELREDKNLETPLFGPKYWYGSGTSYYLNMYYRF